MAEPTPRRHYVVLIVVDGNRTSYLHLVHLPHIQALIKAGTVYDRAWVGEMESSTPDVHVTLGTGTLPRENGFLGFGWAAPTTRATIDFRTLLADHAIDPVLNGLPVPSVATRLHQLIPGAISVAASGHKDYAVVGLGGGSANYELYGKFVGQQFIPAFMHTPPPLTQAERKSLTVRTPLAMGAEDSWGFRYANDVVRHVRPHLLMINLPEMDTWGHWYGPHSAGVMSRLMVNVDKGIGQIEDTYRQLGLLDRTDFIITADHAMMDSQAARNWGLVQNVARTLGTRAVRADGEGGSIWLQDPSQAKAVATHIVQLRPRHVEAIFYRSAPGIDYKYVLASPASWLAGPHVASALQYLVDTTAGRNGPDVWTLYRENYTVVPRNVAGTWKGTHGGSTWKVQHIPLILSGPGIRRGFHSQFPARSVDIAPTMERLLGLPSIQRDGVILADAFTDATKGELAPQKTVEPSLTVYVNALQLQSTADDGSSGGDWPTLPPPIFACSLKPVVGAPGQRTCRTTSSVATNQ